MLGRPIHAHSRGLRAHSTAAHEAARKRRVDGARPPMGSVSRPRRQVEQVPPPRTGSCIGRSDGNAHDNEARRRWEATAS